MVFPSNVYSKTFFLIVCIIMFLLNANKIFEISIKINFNKGSYKSKSLLLYHDCNLFRTKWRNLL